MDGIPILYNGVNGRPIPPQNFPFSMGIWTPCNIWFLRPTRVHNQKGISIVSDVFCRLTAVTDKPTDRQTDHANPTNPSVTTGRICDTT